MTAKKNRRGGAPERPRSLEKQNSHYKLRLLVVGQKPISSRAIANAERLKTDFLEGRCELEVIDLRERPDVAEEELAVATPLLIRKRPPPELRVIGDLADMQEVMKGLGICEAT